MSEFDYQSSLRAKRSCAPSKKTQKDYPAELDLEVLLARSLFSGLVLAILGLFLVGY
jgi:hypothetical protein